MYRFQYNLITPIHFTSSHTIIFFTILISIFYYKHLFDSGINYTNTLLYLSKLP